MTKENAFESVTEDLRNKGLGGYLTSEHLKDWAINRQRYWGTPCPIVYCKSCGVCFKSSL